MASSWIWVVEDSYQFEGSFILLLCNIRITMSCGRFLPVCGKFYIIHLEKQIFHQRQTLLELSSCQSSTSELPVWFVSSLEFCAYWLLFKFWLLCLRFANSQTSWSLHIADVQEGLGYPGHAECNPIIPHAKWWISLHLELWKIWNHLPFIYLKHDIIDHLPPQGTWKLQQAWATSQDWQTLSCV